MSSTDWQSAASELEAAIAKGDQGPAGAAILDALRKWADYCGDGPPTPGFIKTIEQAKRHTLLLTNLQVAVDNAVSFTRQLTQRKKAGLS